MDIKAEQMTSRTQILTAKQLKSLQLEKSIPRSQVARLIDGEDELKKHDVPDSSRYRCTAIKNSISFCAKLH